MVRTQVDKSGWGEGPWNDEPDRLDFRHVGFACLMLRNARYGNWCGYVGVPADHQAYGKAYDEVDVKCHGGLTYGRKCDGEHICHVPESGESDDLFWFGFHCNNEWDIAPGSEAYLRTTGLDYRDLGRTYRDVRYVRKEVKRLAEQLKTLHERRPVVSPR